MASSQDINIEINEEEFDEAMRTLEDMYDSLDERYLKNTLKRKAKPILREMKIMSPSTRLTQVLGISTAKKKTAGKTDIHIGVQKNDPSLFPDFSSYGLASVLEYGTKERFRQVTNSVGFITNRVSTGEVTQDPFLRPSYDNNIDKVLKSFSRTVEKRVIKKAE